MRALWAALSGLPLLAAAATAAPAAYLCKTEAGPLLVSGPALSQPPANCRTAAGAEWVRAGPDLAEIARRLEAHERALARLSKEVEALARRVAPRDLVLPAPPSGLGAAARSDQRLRDLGQDIDRKLDALTAPWER